MAAQKIWTRLFGTTATDIASSIASTSDGYVYIAGYTEGNLDGLTNSGMGDAFISKYSQDGTRLWSRLIGSAQSDFARGIAVSTDGSVYATGQTQGILDGNPNNSNSSDVFLTKLDGTGATIWTKTIGTPVDETPYSVLVASDSSIFVAGSTAGSPDGEANSGATDAFLTKFAIDGTRLWTRLIGTSADDSAYSVSQGKDGYIYVTGGTNGNLDGNINSGSFDGFISKFDQSGNKIWTQLIGSDRLDSAKSIAVSIDGSIYVAGLTEGNLGGKINSGGTDAFLIRFNSDGSRAWTQLLGTALNDEAASISTGVNGSVYVTGLTGGNLGGSQSGGGFDAFLARFEIDGGITWTRQIGSFSDDWSSAVTTSIDSSIYFAGRTGGSIDGGINAGLLDGFVLKYQDNEAPTDLTASASSFNENIVAASTVATLSSTDPDAGDTFTYALVSGTGDTDNGAFSIDGNQLKINSSPDFETKSSYSIRVRTTDAGGLTFEKVLTFNVNNLNEAPTDLTASASSFNENIVAASTVATLSSTDPDAGDTFTYALVSGTGDTDNGAFSIDGNQLKINSSPDFETKSSYSIRVRTTDAGGLTFEKVLTFNVNNLNEAPTDLTASASSFNENIVAASTVATLSSTDPDAGDTFTYALVSGTGDTDNGAFSIDGNQLKINSSPDFETKSSYSIRVRTTDAGGLTFEKVLTFNVNNLNEAPTDLTASASSFNENIVAASTVATLSSTDPDAGDTFTYALVSGTGDTDNGAFSIDGNQLKINSSPDFETKSSYSIRVRTTDAGGLTFEKVLTFNVNNLEENTPPDGTGGSSGIGSGGSPGGGSSGGGGGAPNTPTPAPIPTNNSNPTQPSTPPAENGDSQNQNDTPVIQRSYSRNDPPDPITEFASETSVLRIDASAFGTEDDKIVDFKVVRSGKQLKKFLKSDSNIIYDRKTGYVYFNANREEPGYGPGGGLIAVLDPRLGLTERNFEIF